VSRDHDTIVTGAAYKWALDFPHGLWKHRKLSRWDAGPVRATKTFGAGTAFEYARPHTWRLVILRSVPGYQYRKRRTPSSVFKVHIELLDNSGLWLVAYVGNCVSWADACRQVDEVDPREFLARLGPLVYARARWRVVHPCVHDNGGLYPAQLRHAAPDPDGAVYCSTGFDPFDSVLGSFGCNAALVSRVDGSEPALIHRYGGGGPMSLDTWVARMLASAGGDHDDD